MPESSPVRPLIAGNWKMNGLRKELSSIESLCEGYVGSLRERVDLVVCVPSTLLREAVDRSGSGRVLIGGQDCHWEDSGAYTGDVSASMLSDCGASCVIVGHSERRVAHHETDQMVRGKAESAHRFGLTPIVCVGESETEYQAGATLRVIENQLEGCLPSFSDFVVAYEPIWSIGTGETPTPERIGEVHGVIRNFLVENHGEAGGRIRILYGGSVNPSNADELLDASDVNGFLVGGASLNPSDLLSICERCAEALG